MLSDDPCRSGLPVLFFERGNGAFEALRIALWEIINRRIVSTYCLSLCVYSSIPGPDGVALHGIVLCLCGCVRFAVEMLSWRLLCGWPPQCLLKALPLHPRCSSPDAWGCCSCCCCCCYRA
ncbi:unnamed protein product [Pylaiella littoralis]